MLNISQGGFGARPAISMDGLPLRTAEKQHFFDKEFNSGCNRSRHEFGLGGKAKFRRSLKTF